MDSFKNDIFSIYCENDEGTLDELIVDVYNKEYDFNGNVDSEELACKSHSKIKSFLVEKDFFSYYFDLLDRLYSGSFYTNEQNYEKRKLEKKRLASAEKRKPLIDKYTIWKAVRGEIPGEQLAKVCSFDYRLQKDDYYDFKIIMTRIHDVMSGKLNVSDFTSWCIVMMRCLEDCMTTRSEKLRRLYYEMGDYFDGMAFMISDISDSKKRMECLEFMAWLKYQNHLIENAKARNKRPFETNGVITYVTFGFSINDGEQCMFKACVVDLEQGKINYMIIPEFEYDERINYTFITDVEYDDLPSEYYRGYVLDESMTVSYALEK